MTVAQIANPSEPQQKASKTCGDAFPQMPGKGECQALKIDGSGANGSEGSDGDMYNQSTGNTSSEGNQDTSASATTGKTDDVTDAAADEFFSPAATESMNIALSLNHDADKLAQFYDKWAAYYDEDVSDGFMLPTMMLSALKEAIATDEAELSWARDPETLVMDAGCGTGAVGRVYVDAGYKTIDGVDISNEMVEKARATGAYRNLEGAYDLNKPVPKAYAAGHDVVTIAGVFTVGHVPPESLRNVAAMVRPGGLLVASTRMAYYERTNYQEVSDAMEKEGTLKLVHKISDGPYTMDSTAHYWVYQVAA